MAEETGKAKSKTPRIRKRTVDEWTKRLEVRRAFVAGAGVMRGWNWESRVTEKEFREGVAAFEKKPMGGTKKPVPFSGKPLPETETKTKTNRQEG